MTRVREVQQRLRNAVVFGAGVLVAAFTAHASVPPGHAQAQLDAGEPAAAIEMARERITDLERASHQSTNELSRQYRILGDAHLALGQLHESVDAFKRAREELRMLEGLHGAEQVELLYREANAYHQLNEIRQANALYEYAYQIRSREPPSVELIEATVRLADWYELNRYEATARSLLREALEMRETVAPSDHVLEARLQRKIGRTYRSQYYPLLAVRTRGPKPRHMTLIPRPHGTLWRDLEKLTATPWTVEYLIRARAAFLSSLDALDKVPDVPVADRAAGLLDLADWHLLTRKYGPAFHRYAELHGLLEVHAPELVEPLLGTARLLHVRSPVPAAEATGSVELQVAVTRLGQVRSIETVRVEPRSVDPHRFRVAVRAARFRPAFVDGKPVHSENVTVTLPAR